MVKKVLSVGDVKVNTIGLEFEVIRLDRVNRVVNPSGVKNVKYFEIRFLESGYTAVLEGSTINKGQVADRYQKDIKGVACFGDADKNPLHHPTIYKNYHTLIRRCYEKENSSYERYGGKGVYVDERWLNYNNFLNDIQELDGYKHQDYIDGKITIDKDLKSGNDKRYSKETCVFIPRSVNSTTANLDRRKKVQAVGPDGTVYQVENTKEFCIEHGLNKSGVYMSMKRGSMYKDEWKFTYIE